MDWLVACLADPIVRHPTAVNTKSNIGRPMQRRAKNMFRTALMLRILAVLLFTGCNWNPGTDAPPAESATASADTQLSTDAMGSLIEQTTEAVPEAPIAARAIDDAADAVTTTATTTMATTATTAITATTTKEEEDDDDEKEAKAAPEAASDSGAALDTTEELENAVKNVTDIVMAIELPVGLRNGRYTGETVDGLPHGKGMFFSKNPQGVAWYYEGDFADGCFSGCGTQIWENGRREDGVYENNALNGFGREFTDDELVYVGSYDDGVYGGGNGTLFSNGEIVFEGVFANGLPDELAFKEQCQYTTFEDVSRRPEYFYGRPIMIYGKVLQAIELGDGMADYRIATRDNRYDVFYIGYDRLEGEARILKDDIIIAWGICKGLVTFSNSLGGKVTVPGMRVYYMQIDSE